MKAVLVATLALLLASFGIHRATHPTAAEADRAAVERAGLDYVEALYEARPELITKSVHPELTKFGFGRRSADEEYQKFPMNFEQLRTLAERWNADGSNANESSPKKVEVLDVLDKIASIKLTAEWGIDYMHLAKYEDRWMITQVIWQSPPMEKAGATDNVAR
jgi:hypothetical protein